MHPEAAPVVAFPFVTTKWADVDVATLRANTAALCAVAGERCAVMAMVKAGGYGHGAVNAASAALAGGATWLGVSSIAEAVELRRWGIDVRILNTGWTMPAEMPVAVGHGIDVAVFTLDDVAAAVLAARENGRRLRVHWKLDTGMGRLGTRTADVDAMRDALLAASTDVAVAGIFTHFAVADEESTAFTVAQHERFLAIVEPMRELFDGVLLHCANSAAALRLEETRHDMIRPGIALYGYPPAHCEGAAGVRPAMTVYAVVTQVKDLAKGDSVGYGREWVAARRTRIATVAAGYADGVDRRNGNRGSAIAGGVLCPMIGRISMDQLALDVSAAGELKTGDPVVLLGERDGLSVDAAVIAASIGTIPYEVLCAVSARVPRVVVNGTGM
jgi:alanine racemase